MIPCFLPVFNRKNKLHFKVERKHSYIYNDCIVPAKDAKPKWFKDQPLMTEDGMNSKLSHPPQVHTSLANELTIAGCPAVRDYYETGYVVKAWCDILITKNDFGEIIVQTPNKDLNPFEFLPVDKLIPNDTTHKFKNPIIRLVSFIEMTTSKGISLLQLSCLDGYPGITIFEGIVPADVYPVELKVPFVFTEDFEEVFIPYGTPLLRLIPMKREIFHREVEEVDYLETSTVSKCPFFKLGKYLTKLGWTYSRNLYK